MKSIIDEIVDIRKGIPIVVDYDNTNRHCLISRENNGSRTAYYFSTPIYNKSSRRMLDINFETNNEYINCETSNASVVITDKVFLKNSECSCNVTLPKKAKLITPQKAQAGNFSLFPTTNGVAIKCDANNEKSISFVFCVEPNVFNIRANDKCFALMSERFRPFVVVSSVGAIDNTDNVIAPAKVYYERLEYNKYKITIFPKSPLASGVIFEINLYENKLLQDTTVESNNSSMNNAFGCVAFIGKTDIYGDNGFIQN